MGNGGVMVKRPRSWPRKTVSVSACSLAVTRSRTPSRSRSPLRRMYGLEESVGYASASAKVTGASDAQVPPAQVPLKQSPSAPSTRQALPPEHFRQVPPQSTSVSSPSWTPFSQGSGVHVPPLQLPFSQSPATLHDLPTSHCPQVPPPQSMSVSSPLAMSSKHRGFR